MPWTMENQADLERYRDHLYAYLVVAMGMRHQRQDLNDQHEPGWVAFERGVMLETTNRLRAERGLPPLEESEVRRVEQLACGHIDYATKWALYCAELAVGITPRELT